MYIVKSTSDISEVVTKAAENKLISEFDSIAEANAEIRKLQAEQSRGSSLTKGQDYLLEGRGSLAVHLALEADPAYGPDWWKDDKKFDRYLREFPMARTHDKRG